MFAKKQSSRSLKNKNKTKNSSKQLQVVPDGTTYTQMMAQPASSIMKDLKQRYSCVQTFCVQSWFSSSASVPTFTYINCILNQIDQYATFVSLFDQYRFLECEVWITPQVSAAVSSSHTGSIFTVLDYDDSTVLTTIGQAQDYASCVVSPQTTGHYRRFTPHAALAAYAPSAFTSFANVASPWLDTSSYSVTHYGVKVACSISSTPSVFDLQIRMRVQFKNVR
jgi:hypothetical protein